MEIIYAQNSTGTGSGIAAFLPMILIGLIFYLLIIRPQASERKKQSKILSELKKGDKIITRGGLYAKIINFQGKNNNKVTIDVGNGTKLTIARSYILGLEDNNNEVTKS